MLSAFPNSDETASIGPRVNSLTHLCVVNPTTIVYALVRVSELALAVSKVVFKVTFVLAVRRVGGDAPALAFVILPFSIVVVSIRPRVLTFAMLHIFFPLTIVGVCDCGGALTNLPGHYAFTIALVVQPISFVNATVLVPKGSLTVLVS
jgi:hypothetical protein